MKRFILNHLHFTRLERMGTIGLLVLCALAYSAPGFIRLFRPTQNTDFTAFKADIQHFRETIPSENTPESTTGQTKALFAFDPNLASAEDFIHLGLSQKTAQSICNYRNKGGQFRQADDFQKIYTLKPEEYARLRPYIQIGSKAKNFPAPEMQTSAVADVFPFDPNTSDEQVLRRLGLSASAIKSIVGYRSKGGVFRKKEDLQKIYTLAEADYHRLEPYIAIAAAAEVPRPAQYSGGTGFEKKITSKGPLDINRASVDDWMRLPGIGEKRARQMVNYRESLGGFLTVEQLRELYGLPDSVFQRIQPMVVLASKEIRKVNLNSGTAEDLDKHPYISYKQAKLIVAYRDQHGPFQSVEDLTKILAFSDRSWLEKIRPYVSTE